jgi:serine/threonine protein kinase/Tol biopolymer transport system component
MPLSPGTRIGAYEVTGTLGAGGMGEVYRARDTRLKRDVALKILSASFASDPERLARFQREAEVLASLNHSHIATIYGLEETDSIKALVLELVEGETLAECIARGPVPIDEALLIARQIADALEAAHEQGIVHRDLKPSNIKTTPDGVVKVLDFGLAKLAEAPVASSSTQPLSMSPTITSPVMLTGIGTLLGTAAYMSPEQAKGKPADKRSDIWAFGCVLYQMLTGKPAFEREDVSETLAAVLRDEPDWTKLPRTLPILIDSVIQQCLDKDPTRRPRNVSAIKFALSHRTIEMLAGQRALAGSSSQTWPIASAVFAIALLTTFAIWRPWQTAPTGPAQRLRIDLGADASLREGSGMPFAISRDGSMLAFVSGDTTRQLYLRRLDRLEATALLEDNSGTLADPFFSPDGQWVAFFSVADRALKKISIAGGAPVTICDSPTNPSRGASWGDDDYIVFNPRAQGGPLLRVRAEGGTPEPVSMLGEGEVAHRWPQVLPGATAMIFTTVSASNSVENAKVVVQPLPSGPSKVLVRNAYYGRFLRSGHLAYTQGGTLFAVPFDVERLEITGHPVVVVKGIRSLTESAAAWFDVSGDGTLVYIPGEQTDIAAPLTWMRRDGALEAVRTVDRDWRNPQFAPDGRRLALAVDANGQTDIWVYELNGDGEQRLTLDVGQDTSPVWSPDGKTIVFASTRGDRQTLNLYWQLADGTGEAHRLTESPVDQRPTSWHPSGKYLAYHSSRGIMILPVEQIGAEWKAGAPSAFVGTEAEGAAKAAFAVNGVFSPDGRWFAYQADDGGGVNVFVRAFPGPGGPWQVSTSGGRIPTWSRRRNELFLLSDLRLGAVGYSVEGSAFRAAPPRTISDLAIRPRPGHRWFDLHPDGERFVAHATPTGESTDVFDAVVVVNRFFDELQRLAAVR